MKLEFKEQILYIDGDDSLILVPTNKKGLHIEGLRDKQEELNIKHVVIQNIKVMCPENLKFLKRLKFCWHILTKSKQFLKI